MDFWDYFWLIFIFVPLVMLWAYALVDVFWRHDLSGGTKALWVVAIFVLPFFGTLLYLLFRPADEDSRPRFSMRDAHPVQVGAAAVADDRTGQLQVLADLHDRGKLTDAEFATEKQRILGG
jgi:Phospholipase_D-nuclease N-terminal/Short C-terminal domain